MRAVSDEARRRRADLILRTAREIAEADGWAAVTTRRLSEAVAVSQPVLYSHFEGMAEIQAQVALQGFAELAAMLEPGEGQPAARLRQLCETYFTFAFAQPAMYDAMFSLASSLPFASPETPPAMRRAFACVVDAVAPFSGSDDPTVLAEVLWSALHGMVWLDRTGRLSDAGDRRLTMLVDLVGSYPASASCDELPHTST